MAERERIQLLNYLNLIFIGYTTIYQTENKCIFNFLYTHIEFIDNEPLHSSQNTYDNHKLYFNN